MQLPHPASARRRACLALAACALLAGGAGCASFEGALGRLPRGLGSVEGELRLSGGDLSPAELGPVVVYLERNDGAPVRSLARTRTLHDRDRNRERAPLGHDLAVLTPGQRVRFASRSGLEHRLFAVRGQERLDVDVPANGRSRAVPIEAQGWTRFYCSLHEDETWDLLVVPTPHYARLDGDGAYRIAYVPPGDYRLRIWSSAVDGTVRTVHVGVLTSSLEPIWLDPTRIAW